MVMNPLLYLVKTGRYLLILSSNEIFPSSTNAIIKAAVSHLLLLAIGACVFGVNSPADLEKMILPSLYTKITNSFPNSLLDAAIAVSSP